jgi:hypothetical protein
MRPLAQFVAICFCLQAFLGLVTIGIAPSMMAKTRGEGLLDAVIMALAGILLFGCLHLIPAIAWWTISQGKRSARAWCTIASLLNICWVPIVARCTESGAVLLALIGIAGLISCLSRPRTRLLER